MLSENADGWCLRAVDKKNQPVSPNYRAYSGRVRDRVKAYQLALSEDEPTFHWGAATDSANDGVAIARHPDLLTALLHSDQLVDEQMQPLAVDTARRSTTLLLLPLETDSEGQHTAVQASFVLSGNDENAHPLEAPRFITDRCVMDNGKLYMLESIGPAFRSASLFLEVVPTSQLDTFLSLFTSSFPDTAIDYCDYTVETGGLIPAQQNPATAAQPSPQHKRAAQPPMRGDLLGFPPRFAKYSVKCSLGGTLYFGPTQGVCTD